MYAYKFNKDLTDKECPGAYDYKRIREKYEYGGHCNFGMENCAGLVARELGIPTLLWGKTELTVVWGVLMGICLLAALFIFSIIKKLNKVA